MTPNKTSRIVITELNTKYKPLFFSDMKQSTSIIDLTLFKGLEKSTKSLTRICLHLIHGSMKKFPHLVSFVPNTFNDKLMTGMREERGDAQERFH